MKNILLFVLIISLSSCGFIRILRMDAVNNENQDEISQFLTKKKYKFDYSFSVIDSLLSPLEDSLHKLEVYSKATPVQLRIYNSKGNLHSGYTHCTGGFKEKRFLGEEYPPKVRINENTNANLSFKSEMDLWEITKKEKVEIEQKFIETEYVFVVYWNIYSNYFSRIVLKEVSNYSRKNNNKKVLIILANTAKDHEVQE